MKYESELRAVSDTDPAVSYTFVSSHLSALCFIITLKIFRLSGPWYRFCHLWMPVIRIMKPADNTIYTRPHLQGGNQTLGGTKHTQKHPSCKLSSLYAYNPCSAFHGSITYINHYNYQMNDPLLPISEPRCINKQLDRTGHLRPWETTINSMRYVRWSHRSLDLHEFLLQGRVKQPVLYLGSSKFE